MALVRGGYVHMVAVTLGRDGAFLASERGINRMPALEVPFRSAVGAGDSFLAALTSVLAQGGSEEDALAYAVAAGAAAVACAGTARLHKADVDAQFQRIRKG